MSILDTVQSFFYNAATGNLSSSQVEAAVQQARDDVERASAGKDPAVVRNLQEQAEKDVRNALATFSRPGEGTEDVGALPGSGASLRLPFVGNVTLPKLANLSDQATKAVFVLGAIALLVVGAPYVIPPVARAIKAARKVAR